MTTQSYRPRYGVNARRDDQQNEALLLSKLALLDKVKGPRVGDYLILPNGLMTRFTHDWPDHIQTGGGPYSYYLGEGYVSYSGGLNPGIKHRFVERTDEVMMGEVWFFSCGRSGAHCGVHYSVPFRVYKVKDNTPEEELTGLFMDSTSPYSGNYSRDLIRLTDEA